ncbi:MAG: UPF0149 family protein [Pseudomonadota bacterium]
MITFTLTHEVVSIFYTLSDRPLFMIEPFMTEEPSSTNTPLTFDELCTMLAPLGTINSPAELHGLLCGKLSGGAQLNETRWLLDAVEFLDFNQAPNEYIRIALTNLYHTSVMQLRDGFGLKLLLPDDDTELSQRTANLGQWCYGFLTGFGSAGKTGRVMTEEAEDGLRDLAAIAHIAVEDSEDESDEADYMEVSEYVRMLAASLYLEYAADDIKAIDAASRVPASGQVH